MAGVGAFNISDLQRCLTNDGVFVTSTTNRRRRRRASIEIKFGRFSGFVGRIQNIYSGNLYTGAGAHVESSIQSVPVTFGFIFSELDPNRVGGRPSAERVK